MGNGGTSSTPHIDRCVHALLWSPFEGETAAEVQKATRKYVQTGILIFEGSLCAVKCAVGYKTVRVLPSPYSRDPPPGFEQMFDLAAWPPPSSLAYCSSNDARESHLLQLGLKCEAVTCPRVTQTPGRCTKCPKGEVPDPAWTGPHIEWDTFSEQWLPFGCVRSGAQFQNPMKKTEERAKSGPGSSSVDVVGGNSPLEQETATIAADADEKLESKGKNDDGNNGFMVMMIAIGIGTAIVVVVGLGITMTLISWSKNKDNTDMIVAKTPQSESTAEPEWDHWDSVAPIAPPAVTTAKVVAAKAFDTRHDTSPATLAAKTNNQQVAEYQLASARPLGGSPKLLARSANPLPTSQEPVLAGVDWDAMITKAFVENEVGSKLGRRDSYKLANGRPLSQA